MSESFKVTAEVHFAQHLASNQKRIRDRTLKRLQKWLSARSECNNAFTHDDMLKLWKGLFYCMWMSDKPLIQENLADAISKLIHRFSRNEYTYLFIECFFETMSREWFGLDKFRLEKFMMLVRRFLRESFVFLKKQKWSDCDIKCFFEILEKNALVAKMNSTFLSFKLHIIDIFLEELARVGGEELLPEHMTLFLMPFCKMMAKTNNNLLLSDIAKNIFEFIIYQDSNDIIEEENDDENRESKLECEEILPVLKVNYEEIGDLLFAYAKKRSIKKKNRNVMYKLVKKFKDLSQGITPSELDNEPLSSGSDIDDGDINDAVNRYQEDLKKYKLESEQWKLNRKKTIKETRKKLKTAKKNKVLNRDTKLDQNNNESVSEPLHSKNDDDNINQMNMDNKNYNQMPSELKIRQKRTKGKTRKSNSNSKKLKMANTDIKISPKIRKNISKRNRKNKVKLMS